jgi:hypothetical protein
VIILRPSLAGGRPWSSLLPVADGFPVFATSIFCSTGCIAGHRRTFWRSSSAPGWRARVDAGGGAAGRLPFSAGRIDALAFPDMNQSAGQTGLLGLIGADFLRRTRAGGLRPSKKVQAAACWRRCNIMEIVSATLFGYLVFSAIFRTGRPGSASALIVGSGLLHRPTRAGAEPAQGE